MPNPRPPTRNRRLATTDVTAPGPTLDADLVPVPGDDEPETGPLRRCVVTRERLPKESMIRFVVGPDRAIVPDLAGRLPGRGIWLSASGDVIVSGGMSPGPTRDQSSSRPGDRLLARAFARAARGPVTVPPDLHAMLVSALSRRIRETLGLTRRAGQAVAGFEKAREWARSGQARLIVQAADGSPAERARFLSGVDPSIPVIDPLTADELGRLFTRDHVVHVAVAAGRLAETLLHDAGRFGGLRRLTDAGTGRMTPPGHDEAGTNG